VTQIAPGISVGVTGAVDYEMHYLNGSRRYREPFSVLHVDRMIVNAVGLAVDAVMREAVKASAAAGPIAFAITALADLGWHWYARAQLETDGSLLVRAAPHFLGARLNGIDITATPLPGIDPAWWASIVRSLGAGSPAQLEMTAVAPEAAVTEQGSLPEGRADSTDGNPVSALTPDELRGHVAWLDAHADIVRDADGTRRLLLDALMRH
jgi:hypothetical protein